MEFNLSGAPGWGVLFQRLTQLTERFLQKCARNVWVTYKEFTTILIEIERILNSHPFIFVSSDDLQQCLTPVHLDFGYQILAPADKDSFRGSEIEIIRQVGLKQQRGIVKMINTFEKKWRKQCLLDLTDRLSKHLKSRGIDDEKGDLVHKNEENQKRDKWYLRVIEQLIKTSEG